jgi:hypothetical protein
MAVVKTWQRTDYVGRYKKVMARYDYTTGDTAITWVTGLKKIYAWANSPTSVTAKALDFATVAGGTITITATNPLAACYVYVTAWGI